MDKILETILKERQYCWCENRNGFRCDMQEMIWKVMNHQVQVYFVGKSQKVLAGGMGVGINDMIEACVNFLRKMGFEIVDRRPKQEEVVRMPVLTLDEAIAKSKEIIAAEKYVEDLNAWHDLSDTFALNVYDDVHTVGGTLYEQYFGRVNFSSSIIVE